MSETSSLVFLSKDYNIEELLSILPAHLKAEISYNLYKEAIQVFRILQNREQRFYAHFLLKLEPIKIKSGTTFVEQGTQPLEVYFLLSGCVEAHNSGKFFANGSMFGEGDIIFDRLRIDTYSTRMDCHILRLKRDIFEQILDDFDDIKEDIENIAGQREEERLEEIEREEEYKRDPELKNRQKQEEEENTKNMIEQINK